MSWPGGPSPSPAFPSGIEEAPAPAPCISLVFESFSSRPCWECDLPGASAAHSPIEMRFTCEGLLCSLADFQLPEFRVSTFWALEAWAKRRPRGSRVPSNTGSNQGFLLPLSPAQGVTGEGRPCPGGKRPQRRRPPQPQISQFLCRGEGGGESGRPWELVTEAWAPS